MSSIMVIFKKKDMLPFCENQMYEAKHSGWSYGTGPVGFYEIDTFRGIMKCSKEYLEEHFYILKGGERLLLEDGKTVLIFHGRDPISGDVCFSDEMSGKLIAEQVVNLPLERFSLLDRSYSYAVDTAPSHKCELVNVSFNFIVMACKVCGKPG